VNTLASTRSLPSTCRNYTAPISSGNKEEDIPGLGEKLKIPPGRVGTPEDIAPAVVYLASGASSWMTGHTIVIKGGP
jgi:NAD(P)-dependent dehydrogenase (short-subunit alcohol dehydrogenase family)